LPVFLQAKKLSAPDFHLPGSFSKEVLFKDKQFKLIYGNTYQERFTRIKKHKTRGTVEGSPHVCTIAFKQLYFHSSYIFIRVENSYASFLYCVACKRGPPAL
jgi:hypothetical protein